MSNRFIWLWNGTLWVKALGDAEGHLQVDILSGAAVETRPHGYDGANWQTLLVEAAALKNLRVKLYDGAGGITTGVPSTANIDPSTLRGLDVRNVHYLVLSDVLAAPEESAWITGDGATGWYQPAPCLWVFNGATWDRMRSYAGGIQKVGRAEVGLSTIRRVNAGQVKASAGKLYWMTMNPSAAASVIELSDDTDGSTAVVWDMVHGVNSAHHMNLDPPMEFANGIYLKTLTNFVSVIFGYL